MYEIDLVEMTHRSLVVISDQAMNEINFHVSDAQVVISDDLIKMCLYLRLNSHVKPRPPFDQKTPFFATIKVNR